MGPPWPWLESQPSQKERCRPGLLNVPGAKLMIEVWLVCGQDGTGDDDRYCGDGCKAVATC